jgi:hypothetical protein
VLGCKGDWLGREVELPPDVLARCDFAQTTLVIDGRPVTLARRLDADFEIQVDDGLHQQLFTTIFF